MSVACQNRSEAVSRKDTSRLRGGVCECKSTVSGRPPLHTIGISVQSGTGFSNVSNRQMRWDTFQGDNFIPLSRELYSFCTVAPFCRATIQKNYAFREHAPNNFLKGSMGEHLLRKPTNDKSLGKKAPVLAGK